VGLCNVGVVDAGTTLLYPNALENSWLFKPCGIATGFVVVNLESHMGQQFG